ncbi:unnamed protein product [Caenorhabditis bovis]|uniref:Sphingomyelin synthase-like domain-containing protein n=1 Tax=Caenorhabditis bovis TaxID=2654633 RepID=A0A8S1FCU2_9PELO|nr:unnamed protein product [Caenorhabditis bovis]
MGGHRRDQSDSNVPLRPVSESGAETNESMQMTPNPSLNSVVSTRGMGICNGVSINIDPIDPEPSSMRLEKAIEHQGMFSNSESSEGLKTFTAFLCLMLSAFLNFFLLTVIHDVVPREPLPDLTFMIIPQQRWAWSVGDVLSTLSSVIAFTIIFLHHKRWVVLRRTFLLGAIMYGLRAVILGVTFLPPSFHNRDEICQPQVNRTAMYGMEIATRFLTYVITLGLTSGQEKILCGDLMFSGHTVVLTIMYFVQLQYTPRGLVLLRYIAAPITFLGISALVVSGGHYTMDVLIAYWLTSHVFWSYHQVFEMKKEERTNAPLSRLWWFWLCYWFEADVRDGKLTNEWNWPFEGPEKMHHIMDEINRRLQ